MPSNPVLDSALDYVNNRKWSVIPLLPRSKSPAIPWKEFQSRLPSVSEMEQWFSRPANIGIVTGAISKLVVVDLDGPPGIKAAHTLGLKSPTTVATGRGRHLYMAHPGTEVPNAARIAPCIDIRGDGGFVVAPPSVHESGRRYAWASAEGSNELPLFVLPEGLTRASTTSGVFTGPGWVSEALSNLVEGNRNDTFTRVVGKLHRSGWSPTDILGLLSPHSESSGFSVSELEAVIASITRKPRPSVSVEGSLETPSLEAFMEEKDEVKWLVPGLIAEKTIGFVGGLPETCKTWFLMDLAIESALGGTWVKRFKTEQSKVLFIDQERFAGETRRRFRALFAGKGVDYRTLGQNLSIMCGTTIRLDIDASYEAFRRKLEEIRPQLIIVDSFATFHTKEENSRHEIQMVIERIKNIRNDFQCSIVFIDHENKGVFQDGEEEAPSALRLAGSIAKPAAAEFIFTVRGKGKNRSAVYMTKSTLASAPEPFFVEVNDLTEDKSKIEVVAS